MYLTKILYFIFIWVLGILPLVLFRSIKMNKHHRQVLLKWRKIEAIIMNIVVFILSLGLASVSFFAMAIWIGKIQIPALKNVPYENFFLIALIGAFSVAGLLQIYFALLPFFTYYIYDNGIGLWVIKNNRLKYKRIYWNDVIDYYVKTDYPVRTFHLIVEENSPEGIVYKKYTIDVPMNMAYSLEVFLSKKLDYKEISDEQFDWRSGQR